MDIEDGVDLFASDDPRMTEVRGKIIEAIRAATCCADMSEQETGFTR